MHNNCYSNQLLIYIKPSVYTSISDSQAGQLITSSHFLMRVTDTISYSNVNIATLSMVFNGSP